MDYGRGTAAVTDGAGRRVPVRNQGRDRTMSRNTLIIVAVIVVVLIVGGYVSF